jgi:hypothetical protein
MNQEFKTLYLLNDTDLLYDYLSKIDYNKLDYSQDINLFMLYNNIYIQHYYLYDIEPLLNILKNESTILYYYYLSKTTLKIIHYIDLLLSIKPNKILEKIIQLKINYLYYHKDTKTFITQVNKIIDINDEILNLYINNIINIESIQLDFNNNYEESNNIIYHLKMYNMYNNIINSDKLKKYYDKIIKSKINNNFIILIQYYYKIITNNKILIKPQKIMDILNKLYDKHTNNIEFQNYNFYIKIKNLLLTINNHNNNNSLIYTNFIISYIKNNMDNINKLNNEMKIYVIFIKYIYYILYNNNDEFHNFIYNLEENDLIECIKPNILIPTMEMLIPDILIFYYNLKQYNNIIDFYNKHKNTILNINNFDILLYILDIIVISLINFSNFDNINEIYEIYEKIKYINIYDFSEEKLYKYNNLLNNIIHIRNANKFYISNYTIDNTIENNICMICLDELSNDNCIKCNKCNKQISHITCLKTYIIKTENPKCINCRQ